jgi:hypothetical protein
LLVGGELQKRLDRIKKMYLNFYGDGFNCTFRIHWHCTPFILPELPSPAEMAAAFLIQWQLGNYYTK